MILLKKIKMPKVQTTTAISESNCSLVSITWACFVSKIIALVNGDR